MREYTVGVCRQAGNVNNKVTIRSSRTTLRQVSCADLFFEPSKPKVKDLLYPVFPFRNNILFCKVPDFPHLSSWEEQHVNEDECGAFVETEELREQSLTMPLGPK